MATSSRPRIEDTCDNDNSGHLYEVNVESMCARDRCCRGDHAPDRTFLVELFFIHNVSPAIQAELDLFAPCSLHYHRAVVSEVAYVCAGCSAFVVSAFIIRFIICFIVHDVRLL